MSTRPITDMKEPVGTGVARWHWLAAGFNWKMAVWSAVLRGGMFFLTNLRAGHRAALRATLVEAVYALVSMGLLGAATERIKDLRPAWLTAVMVWAAMPVLTLIGEFEVHMWSGTPRMKTSMFASFVLSAIGSGFTWFAMQRGAFLVGEPGIEDPSFMEDLRAVPLLVWDFVSAGPRALMAR
ncbi:MAG TPA: hypothetical protein VII58_09425 [Acidobacteriaceae bacterium]